MKYEINREPKKPFPVNPNNSVETHGTATVTITDDDGKVEDQEYGIVKNEDIYQKIQSGGSLNIYGCFIENFKLSSFSEAKKNIPFHIISAQNTFFNGYTDFNNATIQSELIFFNVIFNGVAYFIHSNFLCQAYFREVVFDGKTAFRDSTFANNLSFVECTFCKKTVFNSVQFKSEINWKETEFKGRYCNVMFKNAYFELPANFSGLKFPELDLTGVVFDKYALFKNCKIEKGPRETFRIIKNEFMRTNNRIDALEYHKKEMEAYEVDLKIERLKENDRRWKERNWNNKNWYLNCWNNKYWSKDEIILKFNKTTNHYGTSWPKALKFTLSLAIFFSTFMALFGLEECYWSFSLNSSFIDILSNTADVFWVTVCKSFDLLICSFKFDFKDVGLNRFGSFLSLVDRLGIGYGYFQIIQAFRKFKIW